MVFLFCLILLRYFALLCFAEMSIDIAIEMLGCRQIDIALLIDITLSYRRRSDRLLSRHEGRGRVVYSEWAVYNLTKEQLGL